MKTIRWLLLIISLTGCTSHYIPDKDRYEQSFSYPEETQRLIPDEKNLYEQSFIYPQETEHFVLDEKTVLLEKDGP